ncbi:hypothetical protein H4219_006075 [Mycoemilia scoparia]|uniref:Major facilitator superfamily (MFS) profile domain-containing protein n=1 Tax=Mycoemilia scoparia TaxID=417184 RepID=A0A9W7ZQR7_9FUNG|nr:hypothetical protein H4219_006075 [Mycoemilia scoparia]
MEKSSTVDVHDTAHMGGSAGDNIMSPASQAVQNTDHNNPRFSAIETGRFVDDRHSPGAKAEKSGPDAMMAMGSDEGLDRGEHPEYRSDGLDKPIGPAKFAIAFFACFFMVFLAIYPQTATAPAFASIREGSRTRISSVWYIGSFVLTYLSFMPTAANSYHTLSKVFTFGFGLVLYVVFGAVSAATNRAITLVCCRFMQAIGSSFISATGFMWTTDLVEAANFSSKHCLRSICYTFLSIAMLLAIGINQVLSAAFVAYTSWRWSLYLPLPFMAIPAAICVFMLRDPKVEREKSLGQKLREFDWVGAFLLLAAVALIVIGLVFGGNEHKWVSAAVLCCIIIGGVLAALFLLWEGVWAKDPIFYVPWLIERDTSLALFSALFIALGIYSINLYTPIFYAVVHVSSVTTGSARTILFWIMSVATALVTGILTTLIHPTRQVVTRWLAPFGCILLCVSAGLMYNWSVTYNPKYERGTLALGGIGAGFALTSIFIIGNEAVAASPRPYHTAKYAVALHFCYTIGGMLGMVLFQAGLKSRIIANTKPVFASLPVAAFRNVDVGSLDIADLENLVKSLSVLSFSGRIFSALHRAFQILFILPVPFFGVAFILTFFFRYIRRPNASNTAISSSA